jgi:hypothetical protein
MKLIIIGTDHCLQQSIFQDQKTKTWTPRSGGHRYRRLITYCIEQMGVKAILEETHVDQERMAPTIGSTIAKAHGLVWQSIGIDEPGASDVLCVPPVVQAMRSGIKPDMLAGIYDLKKQKTREHFMHTAIMDALHKHGCVLAVVGYIHLGVLARLFETDQIPVDAFAFTYPLVVDETKS